MRWLGTISGMTLTMAGRHSDALTACQRATDLDPDFVPGWDSLGYAYLEAGAPEEAIDALRTALRLQPRHPDALFHLALAYHKTDQPQRARQLHNCLGKFDREKALELANVLGLMRDFGRQGE